MVPARLPRVVHPLQAQPQVVHPLRAVHLLQVQPLAPLPPLVAHLPLVVHLQREVHLLQEVRQARLPLVAALFHPQEQLVLHLPPLVPLLLQVQPLVHPLNKHMHLTLSKSTLHLR